MLIEASRKSMLCSGTVKVLNAETKYICCHVKSSSQLNGITKGTTITTSNMIKNGT